MYPKDYEEYEDNSNESPFSSGSSEWRYERDDSTGAHHKMRDLPNGGSEYDFVMGGGKVRYDRYGRECWKWLTPI